MSIYPFFKGLIPQPTELRTDPQTPGGGYRPRYGNRQANQRARGDLHPAPLCAPQVDMQLLPCVCSC